MINHFKLHDDYFLHYRILDTWILDHETLVLQKGRFYFWESILESNCNESVWQFLDRCKKQHPTKKIEIVTRKLLQ